MMKRVLVVGFLALAGAAVAAAAGGAFASGQAPSSSEVSRLHLLLREEQEPIVDRAPKGPSKGDIVLVHGDLLSPATRVAVGSEVGYCIGADNVEARAVCTVALVPRARTALAKADTIYLSAVFDNVAQPPQISAITGGTGAYKRARGQVVANDRSDGLIDLVFTIES
jgi:hypothetical protein